MIYASIMLFGAWAGELPNPGWKDNFTHFKRNT